MKQDPRQFSEDVIASVLRPLLPVSLEIFQESRPKKKDPDFYVSITTEEENEIVPMADVFVLTQAVTLVSALGSRESEDHIRYRKDLRAAIFNLMAVQNQKYPDKRATFYGCFSTRIATATVPGAWGDIFYLETRVGV